LQIERTFARAAAAAVTAAAVLAWAPVAGAEEPPQYRADQIAQREAADHVLEAGQATVLRHADAAFIKVRLDGVALGERDTITVAGPDGAESHEHRAADVVDGGLWALSVEGEAAEVTLHDEADGTTAAAHIAEYSRGLNETEMASRPNADSPGPESVCGADDSLHAVCYRDTDPVAYGASRSVARLIIGGDTYCTGWIAGDDRLLTNNHCFSEGDAARATEVQFGYQCAACAGGLVHLPLKVNGAQVLATDYTYDFTLFTVADPAVIAHLPALAISSRPVALHDKIFIPEHPGGMPLRIASASTAEPAGLGTSCMVGIERRQGYGLDSDFGYLCDTAGGASGSPVVSRETGYVVGIHHLGGCPNQAVRMDRIYPKIAPYLASA
jgi:hypothetical protein